MTIDKVRADVSLHDLEAKHEPLPGVERVPRHRVKVGVYRHGVAAAPIANQRLGRDDGLTTTEKLVAFTLSTFMDNDGSNCFVGARKLSAMVGKREQFARQAADSLDRKGYLDIIRGRGRKSNRYNAALPDASVAPPRGDAQAEAVAPPHGDAQAEAVAPPVSAVVPPVSAVVPPRGDDVPPHLPKNEGGGGGGGGTDGFDPACAVSAVSREGFGQDEGGGTISAEDRQRVRDFIATYITRRLADGDTIDHNNVALIGVLVALWSAGWTDDVLARDAMLDWPRVVKSSATGVLIAKLRALVGIPVPAPIVAEAIAVADPVTDALVRLDALWTMPGACDDREQDAYVAAIDEFVWDLAKHEDEPGFWAAYLVSQMGACDHNEIGTGVATICRECFNGTVADINALIKAIRTFVVARNA